MKAKVSRSNIQLADEGRRRFLKQSSGLTFGFALGGLLGCKVDDTVHSATANHSSYNPNIWVTISNDGGILIYAPAEELGQGSMTALPLIFAEEFDANWDDVKIEMSPTNEELYGNPKFMNALYTISSNSVTGYYNTLRVSGAQARRMLMMNVADKWQVPIKELSTEPSKVVHIKTNRTISYGEVAAFASLPANLPDITIDELKSQKDFRLIGRTVTRRDLPAKVAGTVAYSINEEPPGVVFAAAVRSPNMGAKVLKLDAHAARQIEGVIDVIAREHSVCVVADNYYSAIQARRLLDIEWTSVGAVNHFDSDIAMNQHIELANDLKQSGNQFYKQGDALGKLDSANTIVARSYQSDYVYHAQIEPMNATVWVKDGGKSAEAWVGTQASNATLRALSLSTGIPPENIILHRSMVGGAFGRRSIQEMDFVDDAAWLSKHLGKPAKVIWTREDDLMAGWFKPITAHYLRASVTASGQVDAWHHRVAVQEPLATAEPYIFEQIGREPVVAMPGTEQHTYEFSDQLAEHLDVQPGIRTYTVLGVGWTPNLFAVESFMDELAHEANIDPVEFRLKQMGHSDRGRKVLRKVADMAGWKEPRQKGKAIGIAFANYHDSLLAGAVEISLSGEKIVVHDVWVAIDPGVAIQPENIKDQMSGAIIFGLGNALTERITIKDGLVQQSNFHDYLVPRMSDVPQIHVEVMANGEKPTGVGQTSAVLVAPAIASAFHKLTGARLRHMPFTPERVRTALSS